jgi:hypothetical protein
MKELANNLDINNYSKEISKITGISVVLIQKIIMYAILTSASAWYYTFETIIDNVLSYPNENNVLSDGCIIAR